MSEPSTPCIACKEPIKRTGSLRVNCLLCGVLNLMDVDNPMEIVEKD